MSNILTANALFITRSKFMIMSHFYAFFRPASKLRIFLRFKKIVRHLPQNTKQMKSDLLCFRGVYGWKSHFLRAPLLNLRLARVYLAL